MKELSSIYRPIEKELKEVNRVLESSLSNTRQASILELNRFLLESPGKRLRPALVILSAKVASTRHSPLTTHQLTKIASSIELIHLASLIHDDVIDHAPLRHNKPSVNYKWGQDVAIALGDYLYSQAFALIASCKNTEVLSCLSQAMAAMCEGELIQVKERDNVKLKKRQYLVIIKKKTASLMASCCRAGVASVKGEFIYKQALTNYGLNFGIAFQVMDDYLDLTSSTEKLGKQAGLDLTVGELTLPFLFLNNDERKKLLAQNKNPLKDLYSIRQSLDRLGVLTKTTQFIDTYIAKAKESLRACQDSEYKDSLENLADFILNRGFSKK